jgi:alpha-N-acetylglucosamine transferase
LKYDIVSVDWKPEQTKLWLHYVEKNCPEAHVTLIPDEKPIPWCWSSGKINCFKQKFQTDKIIYLDTDTIVTEDLGFIFSNMGHAWLGLSSKIPIYPFNKRKDVVEKLKHLGKPPTHYSTGMIVLNGISGTQVAQFVQLWEEMLSELKPYIKGNRYADEISMSYVATLAQVWDIPLEIHGNVCGKRYFGEASTPSVIHYHREKRLGQFGLGGYLCTER